MQKITLTHFDNETHGYLMVSVRDLKRLKIDPDQFSNFSYFNTTNDCYFLEEDCDATKLLNILKNKGYEVSFNDEFVEHTYFDKPEFKRLNNNHKNGAKTLDEELNAFLRKII